ncbi:HNH endonuclease signature motif containing protein [Mycolicibacterium houstonense]|uniref:HNH endonuclease signature motif containing protein n=1 Tax=Mycolicibacterium houstonense TaxID=146021 RepID=UPI00093E5282|nr:HNH endonuclease signature motif containing protein [Mycolicibacterium houstonense]
MDCIETECAEPPKTRGYCRIHYFRALRSGKIEKLPALTIKQRIEANIRRSTSSSCWEWTGTLVNGYGQISVSGKRVGAHRVSYEAFVGPIPDGLHIDHLCRNPPCVNPQHLEPVTPGENSRRGALYPSLRGIRGCKKHGQADGFVGVYWSKRDNCEREGWRCRICQRVRTRKYKAKIRAARAAQSAA